MSQRLYVGNLSWGLTNEGLKEAFSKAGTVVSAEIVIEKPTNRSRGFGFVEMADEAAGEAAIAMWNGVELDGRPLVVNVARPKTDMPPRRDFNRGGRDGGHNGGYESRAPRRDRPEY